MYTRIHIFKFPNKVARDSFRFFCLDYTNKLFKEGLNFSLFIDVSENSLHYLTVWKSKKDWQVSYKKAGEYLDVRNQVKQMGVTMSIEGGDTIGKCSSNIDFNVLEKVD